MKPELLKKIEALGYVTFSGNYNLNLIGVRTKNRVPNRFNDKFYVVYEVDGKWHQEEFPFTSCAGTYWLKNPSRVLGTAVLVHNRQYRSCWQLGLHRGQYSALVQTGEMTVWRDNNKDAVADYGGAEYDGYFGINCHRANASRQSTQVDKWSAGCQVFANPTHFSILLDLVHKQKSNGYGDKCSYVLVTEDALNNPIKEAEPCQEKASKSQLKSQKLSSLSSSKRSKKSTKPKPKTAKAGAKSPKKSAKK